MFPSRHFFNGEEISREMELCSARRLLLEYKHQAKRKKKVISFVLNNEIT